MNKVRLTAKGTRALIMHNAQLASPLNKYAKQLSVITAKRKKTDEDRLQMARIEFEGGLYFNSEVGPYIPATNLFATLINGARITRAGKKIERGVMVDEMEIPLLYNGPRTIEGLWGEGPGSDHVDVRSVRVTTNRIDRTRPIFQQWGFQTTVLVDPTIMETDEFADIARQAGALVGIGDYRLAYGRFEVVVEEV